MWKTGIELLTKNSWTIRAYKHDFWNGIEFIRALFFLLFHENFKKFEIMLNNSPLTTNFNAKWSSLLSLMNANWCFMYVRFFFSRCFLWPFRMATKNHFNNKKKSVIINFRRMEQPIFAQQTTCWTRSSINYMIHNEVFSNIFLVQLLWFYGTFALLLVHTAVWIDPFYSPLVSK